MPRLPMPPVGRVNMVGADHIGLLVFNMFNVAVARESMRSELTFVDTVRAARPSTLAQHSLLPGCALNDRRLEGRTVRAS